jgi:DNA replication protein DnaC
LDFLHAKQNVILLGPPGTGKTHISIALGVRACLAGQRALFKTATEWVALLADAQRQDKLDAELDRLDRIPLLICDEVGHIPFDPQAASLMFMLVSRRYERRSLIVTSNKPFSAWGEIFGDDMAATAMVDRLIGQGVHFQTASRGALSTGLDTSSQARMHGALCRRLRARDAHPDRDRGGLAEIPG